MSGLDGILPVCVCYTVIEYIVTIIIVITGLYIWRDHKVLSAASRLPVVMPTLPLLGHAHLVLYGVTDMVNTLMRKSAEFYSTTNHSVAVVWLGLHPTIQVMSPKDIRTILNSEKNLDKGPAADDLKIYLGNGLLVAPGSIWKTTRRHINPLFYPRNLKLLVPKMNQCARDLTLNMSRHVGHGPVDVLADVSCAALQSAAGLVFGALTNVNIQYGTHLGLLNSLDKIHQLVYKRYMKIWLWPEFIFRFLYRQQLSFIDKCLTNFTEEYMQVMKMEKKNSNQTIKTNKGFGFNNTLDNDNDYAEQITLPSVYEKLKENYPEFKEQDLKNEIITLLAGGTESSKVTISSCLLALAANPNVQDKLHSEVMGAVGSTDEDVTIEHLKVMPYLDQVVKETLRKFPVTPMVPRVLVEDSKLSSCVLPAGATVYCNLVAAHSDPRSYEHPQCFDPDRFSVDNSEKRDPFSYMPFGAGPRMCIGKLYSMMLVKILIIHIIRKFKLSTEMDINNMTYIPGAIFVSDKGYRIKIKYRCQSPR